MQRYIYCFRIQFSVVKAGRDGCRPEGNSGAGFKRKRVTQGGNSCRTQAAQHRHVSLCRVSLLTCQSRHHPRDWCWGCRLSDRCLTDGRCFCWAAVCLEGSQMRRLFGSLSDNLSDSACRRRSVFDARLLIVGLHLPCSTPCCHAGLLTWHRPDGLSDRARCYCSSETGLLTRLRSRNCLLCTQTVTIRYII